MVAHNKMERVSTAGRNENGLISLTMLLLASLLVTPILVISLFSWGDLVLTRKTVLKRKAAHLAEYAFWSWLAMSEQEINGYAPEDRDYKDPQKTWFSKTLCGKVAGGTYKAQAVVRVDAEDQDKNPDTMIVLFNRSFGFSQAPFETGGYPVVDVLAYGDAGMHQVNFAVETTFTPYFPAVCATLYVYGPVDIFGPAEIDGRFQNGGIVAVHSGGEIQTYGEVSLVDGYPLTIETSNPDSVLRSPYSVLGLDPASSYLEKKTYHDPGGQPWTGTVILNEDYSGIIDGRGTIIVHNPLFDPLRYKASYLHSLGMDSKGYDPTYSHLDPANKPAILEPQGECVVQGIVIADDFRPGYGSLEIKGLMVILNPMKVELGMTGGLRLHYCRDTLNKWVRGSCDTVLSWRFENRRQQTTDEQAD